MRTATSLLGVALICGACAAPRDPDPPGRDLTIVVVNRSDAQLDLLYESESPASVSGGETTVAACSAAIVSLGGVQERVTISVDDDQVVDASVPAGTDGFLVVSLFVAPDGSVAAAAPVLRPDPPIEPPAPQGCGT